MSYENEGIDYQLDAIAYHDGQLAGGELAELTTRLDAAARDAAGAFNELAAAIAALPDGVDSDPRATVTQEQLDGAAAAHSELRKAVRALARARQHGQQVRGAVRALAAEAARMHSRCSLAD